MSGPESRRDFFAAHAPEAPEWYAAAAITSVLPVEERAKARAAAESARFFAWRWFYADQMIRMSAPSGPSLL